MAVLDRKSIDADIAETSARLERLRRELAEFPLHLRHARLFLARAEERRRLLRRPDALRQLATTS